MPSNVTEIEEYAFGEYTDQIKEDYEKNNRQPATYIWDKEKQEWQNQTKKIQDMVGSEIEQKASEAIGSTDNKKNIIL